MSIFGVLGVIFVVLKLVGVIDWSWWVVAIPFYPMIGAYVLGLLIMVLAAISEGRR